MDYLTKAFVSVMDFINNFATTISEKFTGEGSSAVLVVVIFYLVALIFILLLLKGVASILRDFFRTLFSKQKKQQKKAHDMPSDTSAVNSEQPTTTAVEGVENKKRTKNDDELSAIKNFGNKKYIDELSDTLKKINEFDNCAVQSQHISNTIPSSPIINEDIVVLSEKEKEKIKKQVKDKNLNELKDLLKQVNKDEQSLDDAIKSLESDLSKVLHERDKVVQQEITAIDQHNDIVDVLATLCDELTKSKADLLEKHSELFNFVTSLADKKAVLLDSIKEFKKDTASLAEKIQDFAFLSDKEFKSFVHSFQKNEERLAGFKKNYIAISESRNKMDENISALRQKQSQAVTDKACQIELASVLNIKINELEELERQRLAKEEAERAERERLAKLEAERLEKERLAREEAERLERERLAKLEAERLEKERLAREEAERIEREKEDALKKQKVETKDNIAETKTDSDNVLNEIKEQIKRQLQTSYSINYDDITPEMLEKLAIAEQKKRKATEKAARINGKAVNNPENTPTESSKLESQDNKASDKNNKPAETEDKVITQNVASSQEETEPQTDYFAKLKQQWAEEEANKKRWAEEKARRKEEEERRKKELAEKLSGNETSGNNK